jgi:hypothetical protein
MRTVWPDYRSRRRALRAFGAVGIIGCVGITSALALSAALASSAFKKARRSALRACPPRRLYMARSSDRLLPFSDAPSGMALISVNLDGYAVNALQIRRQRGFLNTTLQDLPPVAVRHLD